MDEPGPCLNQAAKHGLVAEYARRYGVLVETGLWNGGGASTTLAEQGFECWAIDLDIGNVLSAGQRGVRTLGGDSGLLLPTVLGLVGRSCCLWLDAHYAVEGREHLEANPCPLLAELRTVLAWEHGPASTVLVDDLRLLGAPGWPTRAALAELGLGSVWRATEADDILRLTPL